MNVYVLSFLSIHFYFVMRMFHGAVFNNGTQNHNLLFIVVGLTLCTPLLAGWRGVVKVFGRRQVWLVVVAAQKRNLAVVGPQFKQLQAGNSKKRTTYQRTQIKTNIIY